MKKQITTALTTILILTSITACQDSGLDKRSGDRSLAADNSVQSSLSERSVSESSTKKTESKPQEAVMGIYGETEIPDIPCGNIDFEGKAHSIDDKDALEQCLHSMVFETHSFGDYTIKLVGEEVRTDNENFPGSIYARNFRVELEKGKEKIGTGFPFCCEVTYGVQFLTEFRIFSDKVGTYLKVYDMQVPVIACHYYFADEPERVVARAINFLVIQDDILTGGYVGVFEKGTGITFNSTSDHTPQTMLTLNSKNGDRCSCAAFEADEFKIVDEKTLVDEKAGLKYTFDFANPLPFELYTVERLGS